MARSLNCHLEGTPSFYRHVVVNATAEDGTKVDCFTYVNLREQVQAAAVIGSGDWSSYTPLVCRR